MKADLICLLQKNGTIKKRPLICYAGSAGRNLCKFLTLGKEPFIWFFMNYYRQEKSIEK